MYPFHTSGSFQWRLPHHSGTGSVLSEVRDAIKSVMNLTASGPNTIQCEHLKIPLPVLAKTLARLFTLYLSECKDTTNGDDQLDCVVVQEWRSAAIAPSACCNLPQAFHLSNPKKDWKKTPDEGHQCERVGFREGSARLTNTHGHETHQV